MEEKAGQTLMFDGEKSQSSIEGPVECLGTTFQNDGERRKYFIERLKKKLEDPEFRKIEGFPIGSDEDILALSDPPYYTACPNPFIEDFIRCYGKPYDSMKVYNKKPFAFDITEGRHTWLYKAHTYHTKVPPKALKNFIEHYTEPGEIILDGFAGSGMTGIAALMANPSRSTLICDLSPAASFIASVYLCQVDTHTYLREALRIADQLDDELGWMYRPGQDVIGSAICNYYVWSDVFICNSCGSEIVFWEVAFDSRQKKFLDTFTCNSCGAENSKTSAERAHETVYDQILKKPWTRYKQVPVLAIVSHGSKRAEKRRVNEDDKNLLARVRQTPLPQSANRFAVKMLFRDGQWGDQWKNCLHLRPITHAHQLFAERQLHYVSRFMELLDLKRAEHRALLFTGTSILQKTSRLMVYNADGIGRVQKGTLYISSVWQEMRFSHMLRISAGDMIRSAEEGMWTALPKKGKGDNTSHTVWCGSSTSLNVPENAIDYIFVDPPFGSNIPYSEVNFLWEALLGVFTNLKPDAIESPIQEKSLLDYQHLMEQCFSEFRRVLKPGRWITIEFHNSKNAVWNAIQEALTRSGFVVADVRILDKKQKSFKQATTAGAVKQDLIITAYKPNGGLEERFKLEAGTEDGVWDFTRTHLRQLPVFVGKNGQLEVIAERQNFLLYDRMVAFHVQRGVTIPLSASDFYLGLEQRFPERDGMYFLPEQVAEYDKKRMTVKEVLQLQLFVIDESSAIQWLKQQLLQKPQTFQELHPQFLREIGGWQKHEKPLELTELLEQNFLRYDGTGDVPSQIHSYLSSNFKELRHLPKNDPALRTKAKDRWYVPDPNKAGDLEKLRERALLREFEEYRQSKQKQLKVFRLEAVRSGFKKAWADRDYTTIIEVAGKIPENVLQEDPKLLMWYDQAITRKGG
ncbi:MAG: DNA methyltransferase [Dehalococcoidales bacterium]|nr:DNA methyltransferase [Dehalococcoidales bacterium]